MIRYLKDYSLKKHHTFGFDIKTSEYFEFTETDDIQLFLKSVGTPVKKNILLLGRGSNILFSDDFKGLIISPNIPGITEVDENRQNVWIEAGAGELWDDFVEYCVSSNLSSVENLSAIPGTVGASPVQNIGAYGQEVANSIERVNVFDIHEMCFFSIAGSDCKFGYRDSIFKANKNRFIILSVVFKLWKFHNFQLGYGNLAQVVKANGETNLRNIRNSVIEIRTSKLPDVNITGNAGSFFKNPVISQHQADVLKTQFPEIPLYPADDGKIKVAAGWLIENTGWKGFRKGDAGVHEKQSIVLVNYGKATGKDILNLADEIGKSVFEKYGITLEKEVNVY